MNFTIRVWRQKNAAAQGHFQVLEAKNVSPDLSLLELLDELNEELVLKGEEPFAFDNDCREGICGTCALVVNGQPHGRDWGSTTCQLHMRMFTDGETITIEPFRASAFPIIKDCVIDRSALEHVIQSGGYISVNTGAAPDAAAIPVPKEDADRAFAAAACIGCGACVAACPNASAMLFTSAKIAHLGALPQGRPEAKRRVLAMVKAMDAEGFGNCTNIRACEAACPKHITAGNIARMNRAYLAAALS